jgi:hypothetical protein
VGSLVRDRRELETADEFIANGPLLPIEFCRISADGRLTLAIDETFGAVCKTYSAPSALDSLDAAIENLRLTEKMSNARAVGFVEPASSRQSDVAIERHPEAVATIAAWATSNATRPRSGPRLRATSMSLARAASRSPSPRRSGISKRWNARTPKRLRRRWTISGWRRARGRDASARTGLQALALSRGVTAAKIGAVRPASPGRQRGVIARIEAVRVVDRASPAALDRWRKGRVPRWVRNVKDEFKRCPI